MARGEYRSYTCTLCRHKPTCCRSSAWTSRSPCSAKTALRREACGWESRRKEATSSGRPVWRAAAAAASSAGFSWPLMAVFIQYSTKLGGSCCCGDCCCCCWGCCWGWGCCWHPADRGSALGTQHTRSAISGGRVCTQEGRPVSDAAVTVARGVPAAGRPCRAAPAAAAAARCKA